MSQRNPRRKRKLAIALGSVAVVLGTALFVLWYFPGLTFYPTSIGDGPNNWYREWKTVLFIRVNENMVSYDSEEEARREFANRIAHAETIIQRTQKPAGSPGVDEQVLGTFINSLNQRRYSIVRLEKKNVYQTSAPSLRYALAFDKFRGDGYHY